MDILRIREEQVQALQASAEDGFVDRLLDYLRTREGQAIAGLTPEVVRRRTRLGLTEARRYGITWESSLAAFVVLMFRAGPRFHRHERVRAALADERYSPDERMRRLWFMPLDAVWDEIRAKDQEAAWRSLEAALAEPTES